MPFSIAGGDRAISSGPLPGLQVAIDELTHRLHEYCAVEGARVLPDSVSFEFPLHSLEPGDPLDQIISRLFAV